MSGLNGKFTSRFVAVIVFLLLLMAVSPRAAWAHAVLRSSTPSANSTVSAGEIAVTLKYNSRVDPSRSSLSLLDPDGKVIRLSIAKQKAPEILSTVADAPVKGAYALRWQALSSDGHITRGEIAFRVR